MARTPVSGRPNSWGVLAKLFGALLVTAVLVAGIALPFVGGLGLAANHEAVKFLDKTCTLKETSPPQKSKVFARDNKTLIATIFKQDRQLVHLSQVPKQLQNALIATEDRRFYQHHGVDMRGLIRSAINTSSGDTQGGSTLTMQYVKQVRYYQAGNNIKKQKAAIAQNLNRKIEDAKCAIDIEKKESKAKILDNYLNIAFFGEHAYGIEVAAETYFNKKVSQLTLPESAMLVGLLQAPSAYDPFVYPNQARQRRNEVLQNLVDVGKLSQQRADKYAATPVSLATSAPPLVREGCANSGGNVTNVGFFCDYAVNWLLKNKAVTRSQLQSGGLRIVTTLSPKLQNATQKRIDAALPAASPMTSVLPVVDPHTGDVLAMATSKRYGNPSSKRDRTHTSLPIFTEYSAQGASTYKLFPLLTALSTGFPTDYELENPETTYTPQNCLTDGKVYNGDANETFYPNTNETLETATAKSSNTYFVALADQGMGCDLQPIIDMANKLGMRSLSQPSPEKHLDTAQQILKYQNATELVLGDVATSPLELTGAYAAVANRGQYNAPAPILSITDRHGHAVAVPRSPGVQVVDPQVALQAIQILEQDTKYPGTSTTPFENWYSQNDSMVAGKTGTSVAVNSHGKDTDKNASLWFAGMTPHLVATSALINFDAPNRAASGLPGVSNPGINAYGEYASKVWLKALEPTLVKRDWTWSDPNYVAGDDVPDLTGQTISEARTTLHQAGYKMVQFDQTNQASCENPEVIPLGSIVYWAPQRAPKGSTITVCPSAGVSQGRYVPPPPPPPSTHHNSPPAGGSSGGSGGSSGGSGGSGGGSSGSGGGNGNGNGGGNGNGNGGGSGGGNGGGGNGGGGPGPRH